jgi:hypothetical protein
VRLPRAATLGGIAFTAIGILGFVPGVTTHLGDLRLGRGSHAELFGEFRVSILLNVLHVIVGLGGIALASATVVAIASLAFWLLGVLAAGAWLSLDTAGNWLHFVLAAGLLGLGAGLALLVRGEDLAEDLEGDLGGGLPAEI